jgi:hypothetical protein
MPRPLGRIGSSREAAGQNAGDLGQNLPEGQMQDSGEIRHAHQHALNLDARAERASFQARVNDESEQVAVSDFETDDVSLGKLKRRLDANSRFRDIGDLSQARPSRVRQSGNAHLKVGQVTMVETAFHEGLSADFGQGFNSAA